MYKQSAPDNQIYHESFYNRNQLFDVTITKVGDKLLETDLYCKPTDTHQYLHAQSCPRNVYEKSIAYRQTVRIKRICSTEEKLNKRLQQLKQLLINRGFKEDHVDSQIERVKLVERTVLFQKRGKKVNDSITLVPTYHLALNQLCEILQGAHKHVLKLARFHSALASPPRVTFRNPKIIRDKIVRSKLKASVYEDAGTNVFGHSNFDICKILESGDQFESAVTKKKYRINFPFNCNSCCIVYLLTCKVCSTVRSIYCGRV